MPYSAFVLPCHLPHSTLAAALPMPRCTGSTAGGEAVGRSTSPYNVPHPAWHSLMTFDCSTQRAPSVAPPSRLRPLAHTGALRFLRLPTTASDPHTYPAPVPAGRLPTAILLHLTWGDMLADGLTH